MFAVALVVAAGITLPIFGMPSAGQLTGASLPSYGGGLLIGFYALSATIIIPRLGAATFIAFILIAQLVTSAVVDQFGLFGMAKRPVGSAKLIGLGTILVGIAVMQFGNLRIARP
jgi:transporter family-2 protein